MNSHVKFGASSRFQNTQFSEEQMQMIESNITENKNNKYAVVNGKLDNFAVEYCKTNNIEYLMFQEIAKPFENT